MRWALALPLLLACTAGDTDSGADINECGDPEDTLTMVVTTIGYMRGADGISQGFDIDQNASDVCGHEDFVSPEGVPGIDNGLARLIPFLEASEAKVVEGLLNSTIIEGRLLLAVELSRVDDPYEDDCVDVEFFQAYGEPLLGTDGGILPGQSLQRNPDTPSTMLEGVALDCGVLEARPMDIDLPLGILDAFFELNMTEGGIRIEMGEDGIHSGFFTGSLAKEEVLEILNSSDGIDDTIQELVKGLLDTTLDMDPDQDGTCTELSAGLEFQSGEIFIVE
jgi:hypothetical protein